MKFRKSAHAIYKTEYHIVWIPRYRRKVFVKDVKKYAVTRVVQHIKSQSAKALKAKFLFLKKVYFAREGIWSRGYCVSCIGLNEKEILAYVEHQFHYRMLSMLSIGFPF